MVPASPYDSICIRFKSPKNPASIAASGKNRKCGHMRTAIIWRYMENVASFFSENKNSTCNEKNSGDSSYQVLTNFSFFRIFDLRF
jgi:hypothetical protein